MQTVIGLFDNASDAQRAVEKLVDNGFSRANIDLSSQQDGAYGDATTSTTTTDVRDRNDEGFGDSIGNFFSSLFGTDDEENRSRSTNYTDVARRSTVVTVHVQTNDEAEDAADILDEYGAIDVDERAMQYRSTDTTGMATGTTGLTDQTTYTDRDNLNTDESVKVIEENLQVGKREVQTGGVRLRSRIIERPVEESLRLRQEHVTIQRNPVNRPATEADLANFQQGEIEMVERAEVPVVNKEARVVEEISLGKQVEEREEVIRDTVRKTDVEIENLNTDDVTRRTSTDRDTDYNTNRNTGL